MELIVAILAGALATIIGGDLQAWRPRIVRALILRAANSLPKDFRDRYVEEWSSHADDVPGDLAKIGFALQIQFAARALRNAPPLTHQLVGVAAVLLYLPLFVLMWTFGCKLRKQTCLLWGDEHQLFLVEGRGTVGRFLRVSSIDHIAMTLNLARGDLRLPPVQVLMNDFRRLFGNSKPPPTDPQD